MNYVICPVTITSPAPPLGALALGLSANMVCGERCEVVRPSVVMHVRCPRGHEFIAEPRDLRTIS